MAPNRATPKKQEKLPANNNDHECIQTSVLRKYASIFRKNTILLNNHGIILDRLSRVTIGNGHEEDGLLFLMRAHLKEHSSIVEDIAEIKLKLSTVTEINTELEIQRRVKVEKQKILADIEEKKEKDEGKLYSKKTIRWQRIGVIAGIITACLSIILITTFSVLNYAINKETKSEVSTVTNKVDDLGSPVVVNKRGETVSLPSGYELKMYPQDFTGDTTKQNK